MKEKTTNFRSPSLEELNAILEQGLTGILGITVTSVRPDSIEAEMTAGSHTKRPGGAEQIMHGGTNLVLAETLAGLGSTLLIDSEKYNSLGIQVTANHTGSIKDGRLRAVASLVHQGRTTHIWDIAIRDEGGRLLSSARVTNMIVEKQKR